VGLSLLSTDKPIIIRNKQGLYSLNVRALAPQGVGVGHRRPGTRIPAAAWSGRRPDGRRPCGATAEERGEEAGKTEEDARRRLRSKLISSVTSSIPITIDVECIT